MTCPYEPWLHQYTEVSARAAVWRRNRRDGGLYHLAVGCGDHWHVIDKRAAATA